MDNIPIVAAGREIPAAVDRIRRYCGVPWSGGRPETWAWHYYDAIPTAADDLVTPVDVVAAAALHPGLSRGDLAFFREEGARVSACLAELPVDTRLADASERVLDRLTTLPDRLPDVSISLLSKVLHRKRPHLVPLIDRHAVDWYRPVTRTRAMREAWAPMLRAMHAEEQEPPRRLLHAIAFAALERELWPGTDVEHRPRLSWLRAIDIAIWMGSRQPGAVSRQG